MIALVAGAALAVSDRMEAAASARRAVEGTAGRIDRLHLLLRQLLDAEVDGRGFIIAGDPLFLDPYRTDTAAVNGTLKAIAADVGPSGVEQQRLSNLQRLVDAKSRFLDRTIELRLSAGLEAAAIAVAGLEGNRLMDAIRNEIGRMIVYERSQLASRTAMLQGEERNTQRLIFGFLAGAVVLVLAIGLMLLGQLMARLQAQRSARQSAALLRISLDNIGAGVAITDEAGRIVFRNAELVRMLPEAALEDVPESIAGDLALVRSAKPFLFERELLGATVVVRGTPLRHDRFLVTYLDVSTARRAERVKSEFVSTVSHELRTPVTSIRGSLGMLAGPLAAGLSDKQIPLVQMALRNAERLTLLVNDILDIEKIESGGMPFDFQACDLNQLLREAAETNHAYGETRAVILAIGMLPRPLLVWADPSRIQQVMSNLISNAVKFSEPKAIVTITAEEAGEEACVSIHDRGPGVPAAFRAQIFERFAQADASDSRAKGGTGLGLSIAKAIIDKHHGKLSFQSVPGDTTFSFTVPLYSRGREAVAEGAGRRTQRPTEIRSGPAP